MNHVDATLVKLADPATRSAVFDELSLGQLLAAAYDIERVPVEAPFQPVFDEFRIGLPVPRVGSLEGSWSPVGGVNRSEARFNISGIGEDGHIRVDAVWRGAIVARAVSSLDRVAAVDVTWPQLDGLDAEIEADLGALPADNDTLEQERRQRLMARIRDSLDEADVLTEARFDDWMASLGAASVGELLESYRGTALGGVVQIAFSPPGTDAPSPKAFPIVAAILIRDADVSLAQLIMESKMVRERLEPLGLNRPKDQELPLTRAIIIAWVIPETVFDDDDWPGGAGGMATDALRQARRAVAGEWLAREGIGLVATSD